MTTVAGILMLAVCLASGQDLASPRGWDLPILLAIALLPGTLGHFLSNWAHRHTSAFAMSIMILAVPVIASAGAAMFLDERLGLPEITGGAVVLIAIGSVIASAHPRTAGELARSAAGTDAP